MRPSILRVHVLSIVAISFLGLTGCEKIENNKEYLMSRPPESNPVGPRCSGTGNCLAIHYVTYVDNSGRPVVSAQEAEQNVANMNQLYSGCGIQFQIDNYEQVDPAASGFAFNTSDFAQLDQIRYAYGEYSTYLVVATGDWTGGLRAKGANAWTQPPVANMFGIVMEARVADYANILAHEMAHYLDLYHVEDSHNVLNPVVYSYSTQLSSNQCTTMRNAIDNYWPETRR